MNVWKRLRSLMVVCTWTVSACVSTPLPQPPSYELDISKVSIAGTGEGLTISGAPGAVSPTGVELRITPGVPNTDPVLELGSGQVGPDGSFDILVVSPIENQFFFEVIEADEDIFIGVIRGAADGTVTEGDPGPDSDGDGSPDEIDCAPDDDTLGGQRCP